jgi:hypothetical protein
LNNPFESVSSDLRTGDVKFEIRASEPFFKIKLPWRGSNVLPLRIANYTFSSLYTLFESYVTTVPIDNDESTLTSLNTPPIYTDLLTLSTLTALFTFPSNITFNV